MIHSNLFRHTSKSYTLWQFNYVIEGIMHCCVPTVPTRSAKCRWAHTTQKVTHEREGERKVVLEYKKKTHSKNNAQMASSVHHKVFICSTVAKGWAGEHQQQAKAISA